MRPVLTLALFLSAAVSLADERPTELLVAGEPVEVVSIADPEEEENLHGAYQEGVIYLNDANSPAFQASTLLHEFIHAYYDLAPVRQRRMREEKVSLLFEAAISDLVLNNPAAWAWIEEHLAVLEEDGL